MKFVKIPVITHDSSYGYEIINLEQISRIQKKTYLRDGIEYEIQLSEMKNGVRVTESVGIQLLNMLGVTL